jgi:hypothetical protein
MDILYNCRFEIREQREISVWYTGPFLALTVTFAHSISFTKKLNARQ